MCLFAFNSSIGLTPEQGFALIHEVVERNSIGSCGSEITKSCLA
jgi:hypothetical protein